MPEVEIDDIASIGAVADTPIYMAPPEAWLRSLNMRVVDDAMERLLGWEQIFGTPLITPHFAFPVSTQAQTFWVYVSLTKAAVFDGTNHIDLTRTVGGDYTTNDTPNWNGTLLGNVLILNNGSDHPQYWPLISIGTKLANLLNWPAAMRAKVIRSFGPFLIAFNLVNDGLGVSLPHTIHWSHPADPGAIPTTWDIADTTKRAGRLDLTDVAAGVIVDALPLGETMYIYKQSSIRKMRFVGGQSVFDIGQSPWQPSIGLLAPRCMIASPDGQRHVFASQDDILWHNGSQLKSILNRRQKRRLQSDMDAAAFGTSFMFANPMQDEVWFCYPSSGQQYPDKALILKQNGEEYVITEADGITFRNSAVGPIENPQPELWSEGSDLWDEDTGSWSDLQRRRVVLVSPASVKFFNFDKGTTRDGTVFTGTLQRPSLAVVGKKRNGDVIEDFQKEKMVPRLWPKVQGGPINIRLGEQSTVEGAVTWLPSTTFDPATEVTADFDPPASGRAIAVEFSAATPWRLDGYKIDMNLLGSF